MNQFDIQNMSLNVENRQKIVFKQHTTEIKKENPV